MSQRQPKKQKTSKMFDFDAIQARIQTKEKCIREIRQQINALKELDLRRFVTENHDLTQDEALQILGSTLSIEGLFNLRKAMNHVPANIVRVVNGISLRSMLIHKVFNVLSSPTCATASSEATVSVEDLELYTEFAEKYCSLFLANKDDDDVLRRLTEQEQSTPFNKFLTPPVSLCMQCDRKLTIRNNPCKVALFTLNGPIPCSKVTLECRECCQIFGVCNYTDASGKHFYPSYMSIEMVEISNVTYFELSLYKWFPSLR